MDLDDIFGAVECEIAQTADALAFNASLGIGYVNAASLRGSRASDLVEAFGQAMLRQSDLTDQLVMNSKSLGKEKARPLFEKIVELEGYSHRVAQMLMASDEGRDLLKKRGLEWEMSQSIRHASQGIVGEHVLLLLHYVMDETADSEPYAKALIEQGRTLAAEMAKGPPRRATHSAPSRFM